MLKSFSFDGGSTVTLCKNGRTKIFKGKNIHGWCQVIAKFYNHQRIMQYTVLLDDDTSYRLQSTQNFRRDRNLQPRRECYE